MKLFLVAVGIALSATLIASGIMIFLDWLNERRRKFRWTTPKGGPIFPANSASNWSRQNKTWFMFVDERIVGRT